jgi:hypothetical protein
MFFNVLYNPIKSIKKGLPGIRQAFFYIVCYNSVMRPSPSPLKRKEEMTPPPNIEN